MEATMEESTSYCQFSSNEQISRTILTTELPCVPRVIMNENVQTKSKVTIRSSMQIFEKINSWLSKTDKIVFRKYSQLGHLLDLPWKGKFWGTLSHQIIARRINCQKKHELWFLINGKPVRFSIQEFAIVSGLYTSGELTPKELNVVSSNNNLKNKYFNDRSIKIEDVANVLDNIPKDERTKDRVKLCFIYLLSAFLLNSSVGTTIDLSWLRLVDNLEIFDKYPWGRLVYEKIVDQITRVKFQKDHNVDMIRWNFICCPWIFQIWICEAMPKLGEMIGQRIPGNHIPRWIGWNINVKVQNITVARISKVIEEDDEFFV
ncbi:uncharacterized protein LOC133791164 [Humulus lupulus]|uniref:uncharacterized protein LOC133791164 n=1 Tax=Humulus lupulus TaxID=3486 RepID=UPI002B400EE5|nr:uncharacterized protein LOC133791164 [Humulus lupulus]